MTKRNLPALDATVKPGLRSFINREAQARWNPGVCAAGADDGSTISILDPIGEGFTENGVSSRRIAAALRQIGDGDVTVHINSPGGDLFEGIAIYNMLREHKGHVRVQVLGIAASAASVIAMAGDEIQIGRVGFFMIHNAWVMAMGDRHQLKAVSDWLAPFDDAIVSVYAARTALEPRALAKMCDAETWINGEAAVDQGFADALLDSDGIMTSRSEDGARNQASALKRLELALGSATPMSRAKRRELLAEIFPGKPSAAGSGMPSAADISQVAVGALEKLQSL